MGTYHRVGTFFILVGLGLLVMFIGSFLSKEVHTVYLLLSMAAFGLGYLFRLNKPVNENKRFEAIRRARERGRQRQEKRNNKENKEQKEQKE